MMGCVYRLTEIGQRNVKSLIDRAIVVVEETEVVAEIAGEENEPDTEKRRGYHPALHRPSIGTNIPLCQHEAQ